jgi:hypothetical protein
MIDVYTELIGGDSGEGCEGLWIMSLYINKIMIPQT